ncbi:MAG: glycosyltransferase family 4 protein [Candidatus Dormibacteraeota bacterium]|nr:glycosyltransferase family 4 protein [Candidatus Dormibacteraeota bacterium]
MQGPVGRGALTMRALFLVQYPPQAASTRFRVTQFFSFLEENGVSCRLASLLTPAQFGEFYQSGQRASKAARLLFGAVRQTVEALGARRFDVVVVQRGALLFGPPLLEWLVARVGRVPLVFDFDDAIWLQDPSTSWGPLARAAKFPSKVADIVKMARHVIVCNGYTRDYALRLRSPDAVTVIPTVVDADQFHPVARPRGSHPIVGWIGTHSTAQYLGEIAEPLREAAAATKFTLKIVGAGRDVRIPGVSVVNKPWSLAEEVSDYQSLDIGLYPVRDDAWGRGKTGFKPIVYMSCGVACIASPVGGVTEFISHDANGLLASSPTEWRDALISLVADHELRQRLGAAGRETVVDGYSLQAQAPRLLKVLREAAIR